MSIEFSIGVIAGPAAPRADLRFSWHDIRSNLKSINASLFFSGSFHPYSEGQ